MVQAMSEDEVLRALGAELGEVCPMCRGDLAALADAACPHCGTPLTIRVNLQDPRMAGWVAGLIGLCAGAGFCGFVAASMGVSVRGWPLLLSVAFWTQVVGAVVLSACAAAWVRRRRAIRLMPAAGRARLVAACWGGSCLFAGALIGLALAR